MTPILKFLCRAKFNVVAKYLGFFSIGGGLLVELMKRAAQNKQYAEIDHAIKTKVSKLIISTAHIDL